MFTIYSTKTCSYCIKAKEFLKSLNREYREVTITGEEQMAELTEKLGYRPKTVPQIFDNDVYVGGFDDLKEYVKCDTMQESDLG